MNDAHSARGRVYVAMVNWNGWRDTVECLEALARCTYPDFQVVICDNASADDSEAHMLDWARARFGAEVGMRFQVLSREAAERGEGAPLANGGITLVRGGGNLGFAGGSNVGLRRALAKGDASFAWLLNNDTIPEPGALDALVRRLMEVPAAGQCGSRLLYATSPPEVQAWGGAAYVRWTGATRLLGNGSPPDACPDVAAVERSTSYVIGASILVSRAFLDTVGLLSEDYFLYFEELDWARRGASRFRIAYAHDSVVVHKEGASIGSHRVAARKSVTADYYGVRSRIRFTLRHDPFAFPSILLASVAAIFNRLRRRQPDRAYMILRLLCTPATYRLDT